MIMIPLSQEEFRELAQHRQGAVGAADLGYTNEGVTTGVLNCAPNLNLLFFRFGVLSSVPSTSTRVVSVARVGSI